MSSLTAAAMARGDHHDDDRDHELRQERHDPGQQIRDRVGAERPERQLQGDQQHRVVDEGGHEVGRVVLRLRQRPAHASALHRPVEADPFQDRVHGLAQEPGDDEPDEQDDQEQQQFGNECDDEAQAVAQRCSDVLQHDIFPFLVALEDGPTRPVRCVDRIGSVMRDGSWSAPNNDIQQRLRTHMDEDVLLKREDRSATPGPGSRGIRPSSSRRSVKRTPPFGGRATRGTGGATARPNGATGVGGSRSPHLWQSRGTIAGFIRRSGDHSE